MKPIVIRFVLLTLSGFFTMASHSFATRDLDELFKEYWDFEMVSNPFAATSSGVHLYDDQVPDVRPNAIASRIHQLEVFRNRLNKVDLTLVTESERLSANILEFILKFEVELAPFKAWRIPFVSDSGFHNEFGYVLSATPFRTEKDYRDYLKRLQALPRYYQQNVDNMRQGLESGFTQPQAILDKVIPSFEAQVSESPEEHPFFAPFTSYPASMNPELCEAIREEGRRVLKDSVIPASASLVEFMQDEYIPRARKSLGASQLPDGKAYYAALVRYFTTLEDATPDSIHQRGLQEVARIRKEMEAIFHKVNFSGSFDAFLEFLRRDPQFYPKTADELLTKAAWIAKQTDGKLPAFFGRLPRQPYSVEPVPAELAENYTAGRYSPAPPGSSRGGQYWVNTYALETRALYQLPALTLHEAVPGHHLQIALAYEIKNAPEFRKQFYPHAFGEGWGLYSEKLGVEMGIYQTPYEHFGRLSYEMWRACRLVVDTGIHAFGWSRQQAVDYLAENTALSLHEIGTEVDRYIAWPGQALAYKMGELTLWDLRHEAENQLGEKFDIRDFHDVVLEQGGVPLELLRQRIRDYIRKSR